MQGSRESLATNQNTAFGEKRSRDTSVVCTVGPRAPNVQSQWRFRVEESDDDIAVRCRIGLGVRAFREGREKPHAVRFRSPGVADPGRRCGSKDHPPSGLAYYYTRLAGPVEIPRVFGVMNKFCLLERESMNRTKAIFVENDPSEHSFCILFLLR